MQKSLTVSSILALLALAGCQTGGSDGGGYKIISRPPPVVVDPAVGDPCTEAAMSKYFIDATRVTLLAANPQGANTAVVMKADVRDAVCVVSAKGKVISFTDTTPKSANQIAAEEAAAAAKAAGTADPDVQPKPKKKKKKVSAVTPAAAAPVTPAAPVETPVKTETKL